MTRAMRRMRKYLIVVACIALVLGVAIGGTIAWLQDASGAVTNTFTPSNVDVTLDETPPNTFQIIPGLDMKKDPNVTVTGTNVDTYVFVTVTASADWTKQSDNYTFKAINNKVSCSVDSTKWEYLPTTDNTHVYFYKDGTQNYLAANTNLTKLDVLAAVPGSAVSGATIDVDGGITQTEMTNWKNSTNTDATASKLVFNAYIIQKQGFETPAAAWVEAQKGAN